VVWCTWVDDASAVPARVAFAIGRPVGGAVVRNRVRRRLRALLVAEATRQPLAPGYYLVGARPGAAGVSFAELGGDLVSVLRRLQDRPQGGSGGG
jgi:ribonuclease P protein component